MKGILAFPLLGATALLCCAAAAAKEPAQFIASGSFAGGSDAIQAVVSGVRFGAYEDFERMVLDLHQLDSAGQRTEATTHPAYKVEYGVFPYRITIRLANSSFDATAKVQSKPALPFSVVTEAQSGLVREIQVFLPGPSEFKVIEIDDPAKICIDVRKAGQMPIPTVYTVQVMDATTPEQAYALLDAANWPPDFSPQVLVLGSMVVLEQAFSDPAIAARCDDALRAMGYQSVINERRGNELPLR